MINLEYQQLLSLLNEWASHNKGFMRITDIRILAILDLMNKNKNKNPISKVKYVEALLEFQSYLHPSIRKLLNQLR